MRLSSDLSHPPITIILLHRLLPTKWQRNLIRTLLVLFTFGPSVCPCPSWCPCPVGLCNALTHTRAHALPQPSLTHGRIVHTPYSTHHTTPQYHTMTVVASSVHQFGLLTGFVGAITDTLQGFILPPLIYSAAYKATLSGPERAALMAMSALGK